MNKTPIDIPWEQTANGLYAQQESNRSIRPTIYNRAAVVAFAKMKEVTELGAQFSERSIWFEPYVEIFLQGTTSAEFLGFYQADLNDDDQQKAIKQKLPTHCLRKGRWNHKQDYHDYSEIMNKKAYIKSAKQTRGTTVFINSINYVHLLQLATEGESIAQNGISLSPIQREHEWSSIRFHVQNQSNDIAVEYPFRFYQNISLEKWIKKWQAQFDEIDFTGGIQPQGRFFVNYPPSLMEEIELFPEK